MCCFHSSFVSLLNIVDTSPDRWTPNLLTPAWTTQKHWNTALEEICSRNWLALAPYPWVLRGHISRCPRQLADLRQAMFWSSLGMRAMHIGSRHAGQITAFSGQRHTKINMGTTRWPFRQNWKLVPTMVPIDCFRCCRVDYSAQQENFCGLFCARGCYFTTEYGSRFVDSSGSWQPRRIWVGRKLSKHCLKLAQSPILTERFRLGHK